MLAHKERVAACVNAGCISFETEKTEVSGVVLLDHAGETARGTNYLANLLMRIFVREVARGEKVR